MTILEKIWHYEPRSCLKCGSFSVNSSLFCKTCLTVFYQPGDSLYYRDDPVSALYLFNWIPQESDSLSFLIRQLKGHQQKQAWQYYAKIFWNEIYVHNINQYAGRQIVLVPRPSKSLSRPDHAEFFCQSLSEISGFPMLSILERKDQTEQKQKRKKDRAKDRFKVRENFSPELLTGKEVIFVDDVLTTGGTALAAMATLGLAKNFTVWALASRAFGCG